MLADALGIEQRDPSLADNRSRRLGTTAEPVAVMIFIGGTLVIGVLRAAVTVAETRLRGWAREIRTQKRRRKLSV